MAIVTMLIHSSLCAKIDMSVEQKAFSSKRGLVFTVKGPYNEGMAGVGEGRGFGGRVF